MPRTAITVGKTHQDKWELISDPSVPIAQQWKSYKRLQVDRAHGKYKYMFVQESDGFRKEVHLLTPEKAQKRKDAHTAQQDAAVEAGKKQQLSAKAAAQQIADTDAKRRMDEIDRLNNLGKPIPTQAAKKQEAQQVLRTDGPTPKEWLASGMTIDKYPPAGYAAKLDAAETNNNTPQTENK